MALQDTLGINLGDKSNKICVIVAEGKHFFSVIREAVE
jgi:hypothetical protein